MRTVTLGSWAFTADASWVPGGRVQVFSTLRGWDDGPGVRADRTPRPTSHGEFRERGLREGRLVTLAGFVATSGEAESAQVASALSGTLGDGGFDVLTVTDALGPLSARVQLGGPPLVERSPAGRGVRFQFDLLAPDPLRYAPAVTAVTGFPRLLGGLAYPLFTDGAEVTGVLEWGDPGEETGIVVVSNPGTADAWPVFTVSGPTPTEGFDIAVGGRRVRWSRRLLSGQELVIDTAAGVARVDGADAREGLTVREWAPVPPGGTVPVVFSPRGVASSGQLSVSVRPAFW